MLTPDKITTINGVKVSEYLLANHNPNKITLSPMRIKPFIGVTIHNTNDLANVEDDAEQYTRATVNGNMGTVRTHYYVDDLGAWQDLELDRCNWTCADASGSGNMQTIAIECIMDGTTGTENLKARDNAARLAAYILHKYGLTADNLYTHTYWLHVRDGHTKLSDTANIDKWCTTPHSYKTCPYYIIPDWIGFKKLVDKYIKELGGKDSGNTAKYFVQVGAFAVKANAEAKLAEVKKTYAGSFIKTVGNMFYVQVGAFASKDNAAAYLATVKKTYPDAFIKIF